MDNDIDKVAPQELLGNFSRGKVLTALVLAIVLHIAVIGLFSTTYIYYTWINPAAGEARAAAEVAEAESDQPPANQPAPQKSATREQAQPGMSEDELLEEHKDAPIVQKITEKASPEEIPDEPSGLGISLEDTNP